MNRLLAWFLVALIFAMSGPLQAATMASARGFEKSLYGRSAPWADKYAYCNGDPINAVDPSGLEVDATLNVSAGTLTVVDYGSGSVGTGRPVSTTVFNVFSGQGRGLNNPNRDGVPDIGPLPRGEYVIGPVEDVGGARPELSGDTMWFPILDGQTLKNKKTLQNQETGKDNERNGFYIHPGLVSDGCITFKSDVPKGTDKGKGGYPRSADYTNLKSILNSTSPEAYSYQSGRISRTVFSPGRLHVR